MQEVQGKSKMRLSFNRSILLAFPRITLPKQAIEAATLSVLFPALIFRTALQNNIMDISLEIGHVMPIVLNKVIRIPESWALVSEFSSRKVRNLAND